MKLILKIEMEFDGSVKKAFETNSKIENFLTSLEALEIVKSVTFENDFVGSMSKFKLPITLKPPKTTDI